MRCRVPVPVPVRVNRHQKCRVPGAGMRCLVPVPVPVRFWQKVPGADRHPAPWPSTGDSGYDRNTVLYHKKAVKSAAKRQKTPPSNLKSFRRGPLNPKIIQEGLFPTEFFILHFYNQVGQASWSWTGFQGGGFYSLQHIFYIFTNSTPNNAWGRFLTILQF